MWREFWKTKRPTPYILRRGGDQVATEPDFT